MMLADAMDELIDVAEVKVDCSKKHSKQMSSSIPGVCKGHSSSLHLGQRRHSAASVLSTSVRRSSRPLSSRCQEFESVR